MDHANLLKNYIVWADIDNQFQQYIDFSQTSIADVAASLHSIERNPKELADDIALFYGYNESFNHLQREGMGFLNKEHVADFERYEVFLNSFSKRIFAYILYCSLAEARHSDLLENNPHKMDDFIKEEALVKLYALKHKGDMNNQHYRRYLKTYDKEERRFISFSDYMEDESRSHYLDKLLGKEFIQEQQHVLDRQAISYMLKGFKTRFSQEKATLFLTGMLRISEIEQDSDSGELQYYMMANRILEQPPFNELSVSELLEMASEFFLRKFAHGYGGKAWSEIAQHALFFSQGKMSAEMFLDKALSLEHNGGDMFNKGFLYQDVLDWNYDFWFLKTTGSAHVGMLAREVLFNLQNSSSVLAFHHLPALEKIANSFPEDIEPILKTLLQPSDLKPEGKGRLSLYDVAYAMVNNAQQFVSVFRNLNNLPLLRKLPFTSSKIDLAQFFLSYAKSKGNKSIEQSSELLSHTLSVFEKLLYHPKFATHTIIKKQKAEKAFQYYNLNEASSKHLDAMDIGGKAKGLIELKALGYQVPKAMVFDTKTCLSYLTNKLHFRREYAKISKAMDNYLFNTKGEPILVSVRSGAAVSMPGMMDTVLNVGIDDERYPALVKKYGQEMVDKCALSFMTQFCVSRLNLHVDFNMSLSKALNKFTKILVESDLIQERAGKFPLRASEQVGHCIEAVFQSWHSPRAIAWRNAKEISHDLGTAATVQEMVFGHLNEKSMTCVVFSRDCITGKKTLLGEFLPQAQGEDLVSGKRTPQKIENMKHMFPAIYQEISQIAVQLEKHCQAVQDIEITVENGQVYVLQKRNAVVCAQAHQTLTKELGLKISDKLDATSVLNTWLIQTQEKPDNVGLSASPGVIQGIVVKTAKDIQRYANRGNLIFLADQALPEHAPLMIATQGFITQSGGATSHAAILARSMNKPCVVGAGRMNFKAGSVVTLDATQGKIWNSQQPVIANTKQAQSLARLVLKEHGLKLDKHAQFHTLCLNSWVAQLNYVHIEKKNYTQFLSIAQQTAAILLNEQKKHNKLKV